MMILLQNKDETNSACDAKNAQILNLSASEIILRPAWELYNYRGRFTEGEGRGRRGK